MRRWRRAKRREARGQPLDAKLQQPLRLGEAREAMFAEVAERHAADRPREPAVGVRRQEGLPTVGAR